jgi:putative ABC transport system ATP-binding protein
MLRWLRRNHKPRPATGAVPYVASDHLISLRQVRKTYTTPHGAFTALDQIDLDIAAGDFVAVIGRSGSGKSTLINLLTGIDRPDVGTIIAAGASLHTLSEDQVARWRGQHVGIIFQFFQLLPTLTVAENIMLPMEFFGYSTARERLERALSLLESVDLVDQAHKLPAMLSGGQQQRAAIARALANDPPLVVADEPTGNLDSHTARVVVDMLARLAREGKTVVMVTHDMQLAQQTTRTIHLSDGRMVAPSPAASLVTGYEPGESWEYTGSYNVADDHSVTQNVA